MVHFYDSGFSVLYFCVFTSQAEVPKVTNPVQSHEAWRCCAVIEATVS